MRFLSLLLVVVLTACGFQPLYGTHAADRNLAQVAIANLPDRNGQQLRLLLEDRFYGARAPETARWKLDVKIESYKEDLGIRRDDVATRARRTFVADFTLTAAGATEPAFMGNERSFVSYNIFTDPFATDAAEQNAQERGLTQIADLITNRVALYIAGNPSKTSP